MNLFTAWMYATFVKAKYSRLTGQLDEALEWAKKGLTAAEAYSLAPDLGWAYLELGCIYEARHETEQAVQMFTESARYFKHYSYFYNLANEHLSKISTQSANYMDVRDSLDHQEPSFTSNNPINPPSLTSKQDTGLVLQILGPLRIKRDGVELVISRKSSLLLLLCLAVNYGKKMPKDQILEDIFPNGDYLSQNNRF